MATPASPSPTLLTLPQELRDEIWSQVYRNANVSGPGPETFHTFNVDCEPCFAFSARERIHSSTAITPYTTVFRSLLTCKQIYAEAFPILHSTMTVHCLSVSQFSKITASPMSHTMSSFPYRLSSSSATTTTNSSSTNPHPTPLRSRIRNLTLYIHLDDTSRYTWMPALHTLPITLPHLHTLTIHNHMRPPTSYDRLVDALYLAGPLATLPASIIQTLHFAYLREEVMFESPFLGDIRCSDAIEEHELVVRDVLVDEEFRRAARMGDVNAMTVRLLRVAREHERGWLEKLQRKRLAGEGSDGDSSGEDYDGDGGEGDVLVG